MALRLDPVEGNDRVFEAAAHDPRMPAADGYSSRQTCGSACSVSPDEAASLSSSER
jgi:hypothetical protein